MKTIRIEKAKLLAAVTKNRELHQKTFLEAQQGYREAVIAELDKMLAEARTGKRIRRSVDLIEPTNQTREYDRIIAMLEMCLDEQIELSPQEFEMYVMDRWAWKQQFALSNRAYTHSRETLAYLAEAADDD